MGMADGGWELIEGRRGDFDSFYAAEYNPIARLLALTLGDPDLGFEAADEAMLRAYERWDAVAGMANAPGWVYRTGRNWALNVVKRAATSDSKMRLVATRGVADPAISDPDLAASLATLSADHKAVVVLRFYADWTVEAIGEALDVAPGTVKSRIHRALAQLSNDLAPRDPKVLP